ncbi:phosphoribosyltransferase family protein [Leucobacter sp. GX24907]
MADQDAYRPWLLSALCARRGRVGQVGLRAADREVNARKVRVKRRCAALVRGREVILIDDILTTGATLRGACECLQAAGAHVVAAVVLCRVVRRDTRGQGG